MRHALNRLRLVDGRFACKGLDVLVRGMLHRPLIGIHDGAALRCDRDVTGLENAIFSTSSWVACMIRERVSKRTCSSSSSSVSRSAKMRRRCSSGDTAPRASLIRLRRSAITTSCSSLASTMLIHIAFTSGRSVSTNRASAVSARSPSVTRLRMCTANSISSGRIASGDE